MGERVPRVVKIHPTATSPTADSGFGFKLIGEIGQPFCQCINATYSPLPRSLNVVAAHSVTLSVGLKVGSRSSWRVLCLDHVPRRLDSCQVSWLQRSIECVTVCVWSWCVVDGCLSVCDCPLVHLRGLSQILLSRAPSQVTASLV
jgi:hypothetical protein